MAYSRALMPVAEPRVHHLCRGLRKVIRPFIHERATLRDQIAAAVRRLDFVANGVRQREFKKFIRVVAKLGTPIAERRAEAVRHCVDSDALKHSFTEPAGYGMGKHGWVAVKLLPGDELPVELLKQWIEESYRTVAPKRLVAQLDHKNDR